MTCCRKFKRVKTINVSLFGTTLLLTIPAGNYFNDETVEICVCQALPVIVNPENVTVSIQLGNAGPIFPTRANCHRIYADQIRPRRCYAFKVATDTGNFCKCGGAELCCTNHIFPPTLTTALTAAVNSFQHSDTIADGSIEPASVKPQVKVEESKK